MGIIPGKGAMEALGMAIKSYLLSANTENELVIFLNVFLLQDYLQPSSYG